MTARIEVANRKEAEHLRAGLARPDVRAFVRIMGVLSGLPSDQHRALVMDFVWRKWQIDRAVEGEGGQ